MTGSNARRTGSGLFCTTLSSATVDQGGAVNPGLGLVNGALSNACDLATAGVELIASGKPEQHLELLQAGKRMGRACHAVHRARRPRPPQRRATHQFLHDAIEAADLVHGHVDGLRVHDVGGQQLQSTGLANFQAMHGHDSQPFRGIKGGPEETLEEGSSCKALGR
eukprot:364536-Chlamydomonas_euryale.AAC.14